MKLSKSYLEMILESLEYTRFNYENSDKHPTYKFKQEHLKKVNDLILKVKDVAKIMLNNIASTKAIHIAKSLKYLLNEPKLVKEYVIDNAEKRNENQERKHNNMYSA